MIYSGGEYRSNHRLVPLLNKCESEVNNKPFSPCDSETRVNEGYPEPLFLILLYNITEVYTYEIST